MKLYVLYLFSNQQSAQSNDNISKYQSAFFKKGSLAEVDSDLSKMLLGFARGSLFESR